MISRKDLESIKEIIDDCSECKEVTKTCPDCDREVDYEYDHVDPDKLFKQIEKYVYDQECYEKAN
jgi:hypothetical protein